ncbi:MAG TPA: beta-galactosidase GalA [Acidobacteriaceae bacterium]|nr:beta-galactosidase GalA [Acidobacteriaceae bacterium]
MVPAVAVAAHEMGPLARAMDIDKADDSLISPSDGAPREGEVPGAGRERLLMDFGWRFHFGNANDPTKDFDFGKGQVGNFQKTGNFLPASSLSFDDADWTPVNLPHDWAIELPFTDDPALLSKGFYPLGRDYPDTSVGWYRRAFDLPASDAGKRIMIEFDGAYRGTMVAVNGFYVGQHNGGYDPFSYDVTDFVNPGGQNVLLVRVDATLSDGWFYEGAGIYRHVWLVKSHPVHVKKWGTFVTSQVEPGRATLTVRTEVDNHSHGAQNAQVVSTVLDPAGKPAGKAASAERSIAKLGDRTYVQEIVVKRPQLWSLEERNLYKLVTEVSVGGKVVDRSETPFGIRTIRIDAEKGVFLNGKHVKIKGTCNHQDHAGIGVAVPDAVQYYRVRRLQDMGCNALRTSHNPPTPELLDACDRLGMLVFDETRMMSSNPEGMSEFGDLVRRDRNHPSVFMWSMGNEERVANTERGVLILGAMKALAYELDGSRPVSIAPTGAIGTGGLAVCDVIGYNYMDQQAAAYHKAHPEKPVIGTETVSAVCTRGKYITDFKKGYVDSYDPYTTTGRASAIGWWQFCDANPWMTGGFVWTGFDYRGEPSPDGWPNISSQYGIIDTCGFPKDTFYYYQAWWTDKPVLHVFPHWNWTGLEGKEIAVWVYSNLDKVELLVNGRSLGTKAMEKNGHLAWDVKYEPGTIEARGYKNGKVTMTAKRETTGPAAKLVMMSDRKDVSADGADVAMFAVEVRDAQDRVVPVTDNLVTFRVVGKGKLMGTGNGDPTDHAPDKGSSRKAFSGLCMGIVQSTKKAGTITVEATSPGLTPARLTIAANRVELRPQLAVWEREVPVGEGVTGLWRPVPQKAGVNDLVAMMVGNGSTVYTLRQQGSKLTGTVENGVGGFFGSGDKATPITDGKVEGNRVSFTAGMSSYAGTVQDGQLDLKRTLKLPWHLSEPEKPKGPQPVIGPPPDGSDPSRNPNWHLPKDIPTVLHRVKR